MALRATAERWFWLAAASSNRISEKLDMLCWSIQKQVKLGEVNNLARFLLEHERIREGLVELLNGDGWGKLASCVLTDEADKLRFVSAITKVVCKVVAEYDVRVVASFESFPIRLLWLGMGDPIESINTSIAKARHAVAVDL